MVKKHLLIGIVISLIGITIIFVWVFLTFRQVQIKGIDEVSATSLAEKYDLATEVKSKYQLEGMVLKATPKDDPRDTIRVTVGDEALKIGATSTPTDFIPKVTISRWDEVSVSLTPKDLDKVATKAQTFDLSNGKIKVGTPDKDYILYARLYFKGFPCGIYNLSFTRINV